MNTHWAQILVAASLAINVGVPPIARQIQILRGGKGFISWGEFWANWVGNAVFKAFLGVVLYCGGFWA